MSWAKKNVLVEDMNVTMAIEDAQSSGLGSR
jgi:hypothetical protein